MGLVNWIKLTNNNTIDYNIDVGLKRSYITIDDDQTIDDGIFGCDILYTYIELETPQYVFGGGKSFSYSFWSFITSGYTGPLLGSDSLSVGGWKLYVSTGGYLNISQTYTNFSTILQDVNETDCIISSNKLHHICVVYDNFETYSKIKVYVDNKCYYPLQSYVSPQINITIPDYTITYFGDYENNNFSGFFQDIRVYDSALSEKEIKELGKGLSFHLKMDKEIDDNNFYDCSGNKFTVYKINNQSTISLVNSGPRYKKSLYFSDGASILCVPSLLKGLGNSYFRNSTFQTNTDYSISFWFNTISNDQQIITSIYNTNIGESVFRIIINPSDKNTISIWRRSSDNVTGNIFNSNPYIETDVWHHFCMTASGDNSYYYLDGNYIGTSNINPSIYSSNYMVYMIGGQEYNEGNYDINTAFRGYMSDYRVYRTALSADDVEELYQSSASIDNKGNLHCYELNEITE